MGIDRPVPEEWHPDTQLMITIICEEIKEMLLEKNRCYGDSAINPTRIFSKSDPIEQINVRIDDKINRIMKGIEYGIEDTEKDLIGYLILKRVAMRRQEYESKQSGDTSGKELPPELSTSRGTTSILETFNRWTNNHPPSDDRICISDRDGTLDGEDPEYLPSSQRYVRRDSNTGKRFAACPGEGTKEV